VSVSVREVREVREGPCGSVRVRAGRAAVPIGIIAKRKIGGVASVWSQSFTTGNWVLSSDAGQVDFVSPCAPVSRVNAAAAVRFYEAMTCCTHT
jgi:hypothetical protein